MGIPIDPDDPVNGACEVCRFHMPDELHVVFTTHDLGAWEGTIVNEGEGTYVGELVHEFEFDADCTLVPCFFDTNSMRITLQPTYVIWVDFQNCEIPVSGSNVDGDTCVVTLT